MSSKRHFRRRSCTGKVRYESAQAARYALYCATKRYGYTGHMHVYHCGFCGGWHLGHVAKR